jgi:hypothetical protein
MKSTAVTVIMLCILTSSHGAYAMLAKQPLLDCVLTNFCEAHAIDKKQSIINELSLLEYAYKRSEKNWLQKIFKQGASVIQCRDNRQNTLLHHMAGKYELGIISDVITQAKQETGAANNGYRRWLAAKNKHGHRALCTPFADDTIKNSAENFADTVIALKKAGALSADDHPWCDPVFKLLHNDTFGPMIRCLKEGFLPVHALKLYPEKIVSALFFHKFLNKNGVLPHLVQVHINGDTISLQKNEKYGMQKGELWLRKSSTDEWQKTASLVRNWNYETYVSLDQPQQNKIVYQYGTPSGKN